jgi:ADP-ribosyl-[dinitrogen reductase] hydrolase
MTDPALKDRMRGCLLGLAVGDAVGTTVEFRARGTFPPAVDMVGGGPFGLSAGEWTDDTSMALCLASSLVELGRFDAADQMERYCRWRERGYWSSTGDCFDIGNTVRGALDRFRATGDPWSGSTSSNSAGNGSLMRLAPVPMYFFPDAEAAVRWSGESSRTTHGAAECVESCELLAAMLVRALEGRKKNEVLSGHDLERLECDKVRAIAEGSYTFKSYDELRGTGYVIDCFEAAVWCFREADSYRDAILSAVNLGQDADTTAAVCGQLAGAYYGESGIPADWLERLAMREEILSLADRLAAA